MYVIIVGGGNVGYFLAKALSGTQHEVLLMEKDRVRHRFVSEELGEIAMQGDGCEVRLLEEAGAARADVVVACTGDDEDNLVICQMAKMNFNVGRTIARVNNPRNESLFHKLGIDSTVSSTKIIYNLIEQEIEVAEVIPLAAMRRGNLEIVEVEIGPRSPALNMEIRQIKLPEGALIVAVMRDDVARVASGETRMLDGDTLIAVCLADKEHEFRESFSEASV
jgi:trk system potassium uptake protein TrkA